MNDLDLSKEKWDEQWLLATLLAPKQLLLLSFLGPCQKGMTTMLQASVIPNPVEIFGSRDSKVTGECSWQCYSPYAKPGETHSS